MVNDNTLSIKESFLSIKTRDDVAALLNIKEHSLRYFLFKRRPENMYHIFKILKKKGGYREISSPTKELKSIQKKLANVLSSVYTPKICAYGFINSKSFIDNANQHIKKNLVFNIDLKDFFSQIHFGRIHGMLINAPYNIGNEAAIIIAQIACLNGVLPQGSPSSPILTNMICVPLDNSLMRLAKSTGCIYTRYADDITFSTYKKFFNDNILYMEHGVVCIGRKLLSIFKQHSFIINPEKVTLRTRFDRQEVTGLTVNDFPNLRRSYIKNLRAIIHHCDKNGIYETSQEYVSKGLCKNKKIVEIIKNQDKKEDVLKWFKMVLSGKINYIKQVKGESDLTYLSFAKNFNKIFKDNTFNVSALTSLEELIIQNTYILEYSRGGKYKQGSGFFLKDFGIFTSYHVTQDGEFFELFKQPLYPDNSLGFICKTLNEISSEINIDYALYKPKLSICHQNLLIIGDSKKLKIGDQVITAGYPNFEQGNSPYIQTCSITSTKSFHGSLFYTISGRIVHGTSGGVVLNSLYEVIGIIKGGIVSLSEDEQNENQGFVPIHLVINHLETIKVEPIVE